MVQGYDFKGFLFLSFLSRGIKNLSVYVSAAFQYILTINTTCYKYGADNNRIS